MNAAPQIFDPINQRIIEDIKTELRLQGHYLTGALEASLRAYEIDANGAVILTASSLEYLADLETGIPSALISYNSLDEMTRYVELRMGYQGSKARSVAFLILKKQKKEGNPTSASYRFSKTGLRTEAVEQTFDKNQERYFEGIDSISFGQLDNLFTQNKSGTI